MPSLRKMTEKVCLRQAIPRQVRLRWDYAEARRIDTLKVGQVDVVNYEYIGSRVARRSYVSPSPDVNWDYSYDNLGRVTEIHGYKGQNDIIKFNYEYEPNTNNISKMAYHHRPNEPNNAFSYDNLDRLTRADYLIGVADDNEIFTLDDLGNRDLVKVQSGDDVNYVIDNFTNRHTSIDGNNDGMKVF